MGERERERPAAQLLYRASWEGERDRETLWGTAIGRPGVLEPRQLRPDSWRPQGALAAEVRERLYKHPACAAGSHPRPRVVARLHPWPLCFPLALGLGRSPPAVQVLRARLAWHRQGIPRPIALALPRLGLPSRWHSLSSGSHPIAGLTPSASRWLWGASGCGGSVQVHWHWPRLLVTVNCRQLLSTTVNCC